jgi:hypothetical protein
VSDFYEFLKHFWSMFSIFLNMFDFYEFLEVCFCFSTNFMNLSCYIFLIILVFLCAFSNFLNIFFKNLNGVLKSTAIHVVSK